MSVSVPAPTLVKAPVPLMAPPRVVLLLAVLKVPPPAPSAIGVFIVRLFAPTRIVPPVTVALLPAQPRAPLLVARKVPPLPSIPPALLPLPHMPA